MLQGLDWRLSPSDQVRLNRARLAAMPQASAMLQAFESTFGPIRAGEMATAEAVLGQPLDKIDFVVRYAFGYLWAGRSDKPVAPPLSYQTLSTVRGPDPMLPALPASAWAVVPLMLRYLAAIQPALALEDARAGAMWMRQQLQVGTLAPSLDRGGMEIVDHRRVVAVRPGFRVEMAPTVIAEALSDTGSAVVITVTATSTQDDRLIVDIGGCSADVDASAFLRLGLSEGASFAPFHAHGAGPRFRIEMRFPGLTVVPMGPATWKPDGGSRGAPGWLCPDLLQHAMEQAEAAGKARTPPTEVGGWTFSRTPIHNFAAGGDFGWLKALVISYDPTITITSAVGRYFEGLGDLPRDAPLAPDLFGVTLSVRNRRTYTATIGSPADGGSVLTLAPQNDGVGGAQEGERAWVVAAEVGYVGRGPA